jgi:hypothetical protein
MKMTKAQAEEHQIRHGFAVPAKFSHLIKQPTKPATPRIPKPRMNRAEVEYALVLEAMKRRGDIVSWAFEAITLRLADGCRYTPDFFVVVERLGGLRLRFIEVKGKHIWDDAKVKWRVAKEQNPWAEWEMHQKTRDGWKRIL